MTNQHIRLAMLDIEEIEEDPEAKTYSASESVGEYFDGIVVSKWDVLGMDAILREKILPKMITDKEVDACQRLIRIFLTNPKIHILPLDNHMFGITGLRKSKIWWSVFWRSKVVDICSIAITILVAVKLFPALF